MYNETSNAYSIYQQNEILTAPRGKLLLMLYDGAIKFLKFAKKSMDEKNIENTNKYLRRAQDIINELMVTLNMDYDIAKQLYSLYDYMEYRLIQANIKKDKNMVDEVIGLLSELREAWEEAINSL